MGKKTLLIFCEGSTDRVTLYEPLKNYFNQRFQNITIEITRGDIGYKDEINPGNCIEFLENKVNDFLRRNILFSTEVIAVVQLIDTDGAFINIDSMHEDLNATSYRFTNDKVYVNNKEKVTNRFNKKRRIYEILWNTSLLSNIKYLKFFVSRNLEHAFYNRTNLSENDKIILAADFSDQYKNDANGFENFLKSIKLSLPDEYFESWKYIFKDNNSIKRCSNLYMLLDMINNEVR